MKVILNNKPTKFNNNSPKVKVNCLISESLSMGDQIPPYLGMDEEVEEVVDRALQ